LLEDGTIGRFGTITGAETGAFFGRGKGADGTVTGVILGNGGVFTGVEGDFVIGIVVVVWGVGAFIGATPAALSGADISGLAAIGVFPNGTSTGKTIGTGKFPGVRTPIGTGIIWFGPVTRLVSGTVTGVCLRTGEIWTWTGIRSDVGIGAAVVFCPIGDLTGVTISELSGAGIVGLAPTGAFAKGARTGNAIGAGTCAAFGTGKGTRTSIGFGAVGTARLTVTGVCLGIGNSCVFGTSTGAESGTFTAEGADTEETSDMLNL
jgi:hypothetical protein